MVSKDAIKQSTIFYRNSFYNRTECNLNDIFVS